MTRWLLLGSAIVLEVIAALSLKAAGDHAALYLVVLVGYLASFMLLALLLRRGMALGVIAGIWGALGVASTAVLSTLIYHEPFTLLMGLGLGMVVVGVLAVEVGASRAHGHRTGAEATAASTNLELP